MKQRYGSGASQPERQWAVESEEQKQAKARRLLDARGAFLQRVREAERRGKQVAIDPVLRSHLGLDK
jgi:hypothetical protein